MFRHLDSQTHPLQIGGLGWQKDTELGLRGTGASPCVPPGSASSRALLL